MADLSPPIRAWWERRYPPFCYLCPEDHPAFQRDSWSNDYVMSSVRSVLHSFERSARSNICRSLFLRERTPVRTAFLQRDTFYSGGVTMRFHTPSALSAGAYGFRDGARVLPGHLRVLFADDHVSDVDRFNWPRITFLANGGPPRSLAEWAPLMALACSVRASLSLQSEALSHLHWELSPFRPDRFDYCRYLQSLPWPRERIPMDSMTQQFDSLYGVMLMLRPILSRSHLFTHIFSTGGHACPDPVLLDSPEARACFFAFSDCQRSVPSIVDCLHDSRATWAASFPPDGVRPLFPDDVPYLSFPVDGEACLPPTVPLGVSLTLPVNRRLVSHAFVVIANLILFKN